MAEFVIDTGSASVSLYMSTAKHSNKNLAIMSHNTWYYMPLIAPGDTIEFESKVWSYDPSKPTFCAYGDKQYVVPNKSEAVMTYDIPAGTYDPDTFATLIASYISQNGSRTVSNSFTATVNSQTINVAAGTPLTYTYQYSGSAKFVGFNGNFRGGKTFQNSSDFTTNKQYCVGWTYIPIQGNMYKNFKITIGTGIKFK